MIRWTAVAVASLLTVGCVQDTREHAVSADAVNTAVKRLDSGAGSTTIEDADGRKHTVDRYTTVHLTWSDGKANGQAALGVLGPDCREGTGWSARMGPLGQPGCPLTDGKTAFSLIAPEAKPDWEKIVGYPIAIGLVGGVAALEVGCFASWCNGTGRALVITADVATVLGVLGFLAFYEAVQRGMR